MRIFVSGIAGFLGCHLAQTMLDDGHEVIGIDNMIGGERDNIPPYAEFHNVDCDDFFAVNRLMRGCDIVYHCAALAYEGLSVFSPYLVTHNIVSASASVFSAAIANRVKRIVYCSSMARYGDIRTPFIEEWGLPMPQDPYGISKLAAEDILRSLCETHGVEHVIAVPHNIIGPKQKYDDPYRNVASIMINLMLQGRQPIIYGNGRQTRCFSYIDDCLSCLKEMAFRPVSGEVINIGPDEGAITITDLACRIARHLSFDLMIPKYLPGRPCEVKIAVCSSEKARRLLDYKTTTDLDTALASMIAYIRKRGPRPFRYHLPIEIESDLTPKSWKEQLF